MAHQSKVRRSSVRAVNSAEAALDGIASILRDPSIDAPTAVEQIAEAVERTGRVTEQGTGLLYR